MKPAKQTPQLGVTEDRLVGTVDIRASMKVLPRQARMWLRRLSLGAAPDDRTACTGGNNLAGHPTTALIPKRCWEPCCYCIWHMLLLLHP